MDEGTRDYLEVLRYIPRHNGNGIFVLLDFHHYVQDPIAVRGLRDLIREIAPQQKTAVILSPVLNISPELEKEV